MTDNLGAGRDLDRFFMVVVLSALAIPRDKVLHPTQYNKDLV